MIFEWNQLGFKLMFVWYHLLWKHTITRIELKHPWSKQLHLNHWANSLTYKKREYLSNIFWLQHCFWQCQTECWYIHQIFRLVSWMVKVLVIRYKCLRFESCTFFTKLKHNQTEIIRSTNDLILKVGNSQI